MGIPAEHPVRRLRVFLGLTQRELADRIESHMTYISQVETGSQPLGHEIALRLADHFRAELGKLGLTVEDLLRGKLPSRGSDRPSAA